MSLWKGPSFRSYSHFPLCIVCGKENPIGFKLDFRQEGETVKAEFTPGEFHQGWPEIVHGGVLGLLLDEATVYVPRFFRFELRHRQDGGKVQAACSGRAEAPHQCQDDQAK